MGSIVRDKIVALCKDVRKACPFRLRPALNASLSLRVTTEDTDALEKELEGLPLRFPNDRGGDGARQSNLRAQAAILGYPVIWDAENTEVKTPDVLLEVANVFDI